MKVILTADVKGKGKKGDLIEGILASGRMVAQVVGATNPAPPADTPDTGA